MRERILNEIRRLAKVGGGKAPGQNLFHKETGIRESDWRGKYWARWGDALVEAGYQPNDWTGPIDQGLLLEKLVQVCHHYGKVPTNAEIDLYRRTHPDIPPAKAYGRHFKTKNGMLRSLSDWLNESQAGHGGFVIEVPSDDEPTCSKNAQSDGFVYLLAFGDYYKIGQSKNIERRLREITVSLPQKGQLIHAIRTDDPIGIEAYWHRRFSDRRVNGEWFQLTRTDVAAFKRRKFQ
jgi:hypothetical protein